MKKLKTAILILILSFAINIVPDFNPSETPEVNTNLANIENAISASDPSLYFKSATFDYYLGKNADGTSRMRVKETYEAVFSETSTSHGISRYIPFVNQNGKNIIIENLNITATRNGKSEPIAKKTKDGDNYIVNVGSSSVTVQGPQIYTLEYEFNNVITEFDQSSNNVSGQQNNLAAYQELYWNTNGNGWDNKFEKLTANLHFEDGIEFDKTFSIKTLDSKTIESSRPYCYTGVKGSSRQDCTITTNTDGFTFETTKILNYRENLTFVIDLPPNTFTVKEIPKSYILVIITAVIGLVCLLIIFLFIRYYNKHAKEKRAYAKSLFVAPQYQPPEKITVAEAGEIYPKAKKPTYVATLLELATQHKIQIISEKGETSILKREITIWKVKVLSDEHLTASQVAVLKILNGGPTAKTGDIIEIKKHDATRSLASTARSYITGATSLLKNSGHLEKNLSIISMGSNSASIKIFFSIVLFACFGPWLFIVPYFTVQEMLETTRGDIIGKDYLYFVIGGIILATFIICVVIGNMTSKYKRYTNKGLDLVNYLDGLYLYIDMAEEDRLKFNQSVQNAPRTKENIVKLYEKLLPYACIFGLEESWFEELDKYYKVVDYDPDWYSGSDMFSYAAFHSMMSTTSNTMTSSTSYSESSGSGGFSSGGGGGGSSGGGGGGGGGGSW